MTSPYSIDRHSTSSLTAGDVRKIDRGVDDLNPAWKHSPDCRGGWCPMLVTSDHGPAAGECGGSLGWGHP